MAIKDDELLYQFQKALKDKLKPSKACKSNILEEFQSSEKSIKHGHTEHVKHYDFGGKHIDHHANNHKQKIVGKKMSTSNV